MPNVRDLDKYIGDIEAKDLVIVSGEDTANAYKATVGELPYKAIRDLDQKKSLGKDAILGVATPEKPESYRAGITSLNPAFGADTNDPAPLVGGVSTWIKLELKRKFSIQGGNTYNTLDGTFTLPLNGGVYLIQLQTAFQFLPMAATDFVAVSIMTRAGADTAVVAEQYYNTGALDPLETPTPLTPYYPINLTGVWMGPPTASWEGATVAFSCEYYTNLPGLTQYISPAGEFMHYLSVVQIAWANIGMNSVASGVSTNQGKHYKGLPLQPGSTRGIGEVFCELDTIGP